MFKNLVGENFKVQKPCWRGSGAGDLWQRKLCLYSVWAVTIKYSVISHQILITESYSIKYSVISPSNTESYCHQIGNISYLGVLSIAPGYTASKNTWQYSHISNRQCFRVTIQCKYFSGTTPGCWSRDLSDPEAYGHLCLVHCWHLAPPPTGAWWPALWEGGRRRGR